MNCCGIFCNPQEGSESQSEVCSHLPTPGTISCACHVQILFGVQKRILQLCKTDESSGKGCCPCRNDSPATKQIRSHLRLPADVAVAERQQRNLPQSQDNSACHAKIRPAGGDSSPQEM